MKKPFYNSNKVSVIGCGRVGMTAAFAMVMEGELNELVLVGRDVDSIVGEALDLEHGLAFMHHTTITATEDYADIAGSDVVVITAGTSQKPGDNRLDLLEKNKAIIEGIIPQVVKYAPEAVILMVTNPVDVLTYHAYRLADLPKGQILGSGTVLDSARFRFHLSEFLKVNPKSIHAYILGEHGDHSFAAMASASVGGQPLNTFPNFSPQQAQKAYEQARDAAYKIIASKGATFYGIGVVINHIVSTILRNNRSVLPVSVPLHNYMGHSGIALSIPCIVGRRGVEQSLEIKLSWEEKEKLDRCVTVLKEYV
jgi:L-lactate dehydrogenase